MLSFVFEFRSNFFPQTAKAIVVTEPGREYGIIGDEATTLAQTNGETGNFFFQLNFSQIGHWHISMHIQKLQIIPIPVLDLHHPIKSGIIENW